MTEGILTLKKAVGMLEVCAGQKETEGFFGRLDEEDGGSRLARLLLEECTHLDLIVGTAINVSYERQNLPKDFATRMDLIARLKTVMKKLGKEVRVTYC